MWLSGSSQRCLAYFGCVELEIENSKANNQQKKDGEKN